MPRFFIPNISLKDQNIIISAADEAHHIVRVLRLKTGDDVELINGLGTLARGVITRILDHEVFIRINDCLTMKPREKGRIILACALPKKAKFEVILEKCTELGVDEIIPMMTERTEVRPHSGGGKEERFEKVIVNASKQSKRLFFPILHPVMTFDDVLTRFASPERVVFIPWLEGNRISLKDAVSRNPSSKDFLVLIGPEGDFTSQEVERSIERGALAVTLGDNTLKVDTAATAVVAGLRLFCDA
ncbi:MAG: 16S rRNA (uracil(1498)-N(3))-methyltransferase [Candidatus Omnitrophica bacterium]|nr:16S rRNA (uracil(1498)-N(3))-methyltransferase [Candidatus Omnitrophota bacterium]